MYLFTLIARPFSCAKFSWFCGVLSFENLKIESMQYLVFVKFSFLLFLSYIKSFMLSIWRNGKLLSALLLLINFYLEKKEKQ